MTLRRIAGPSLKSRYKRKGCFGKRARSPGSDSNASEEGRDNIRIQIENRMQKENTGEVCKKQEDFLKKLFQFMRDRKTPISRIPNLGFKQSKSTGLQTKPIGVLYESTQKARRRLAFRP